MSYQVLARKWRPRNFSEMVGQDHVLQALTNALDKDRLHHAYLFTGTRGVGKTTVARILAKSMNCEAGVSSQPCGECSACQEIDAGRFVDLIEVDAASRTKVDETRELLENVQYTPTRGRYKVYLIDEVHMFSGHSFNALLKTLEEPPPHVKFLLATTDPQKLPATILSRCLQFNLKRMPQPLIAEFLGRILASEQVDSEPAALQLLARAADGSMRDALSLLDQAIVHGGGGVQEVQVRGMLGTIELRHVHEMLELLATGDAAGLLTRIAQLAEQSPDFAGVLADMLSVLQRIAVVQVLANDKREQPEDDELILALAKSMSPEDVQLYYQIGLQGRRDLYLAPDLRGGFEMTVLRMLAFRPGSVQAPAPEKSSGAIRSGAVTSASGSTAGKLASPAAPAPVPAKAPAKAGTWDEVIAAMGLKGMVKELAANCAFGGRQEDVVRLSLDPAHDHLRKGNLEQRLQDALCKHYGTKVRVQFGEEAPHTETPAQRQAREEQERRKSALDSIQEDANVKALQEQFDARLEVDSVQPLK